MISAYGFIDIQITFFKNKQNYSSTYPFLFWFSYFFHI